MLSRNSVLSEGFAYFVHSYYPVPIDKDLILYQTDYGDITLQWGKPSHTIDCENLYIGNLDGELDIQPNLQANGDDLAGIDDEDGVLTCLLYTSPSPRDSTRSRMPSSA